MDDRRLNRIREKLSGMPCAAWELTETQEERWEFYYIGKRLDQNRAVKVTGTNVRLYKKSEDGQFMGSAAGTIPPTASDKEIGETLEKLLFQASLVKNPVYTITDKPVSADPGGETVNVAQIAGDCIRALTAVPALREEVSGPDGIREEIRSRLNSCEIFVSGITRHFLNSNGVEYTCTYPQTEIEAVVNAGRGTEEIELHRVYHSGSCDSGRLARDIEDVMRMGRDRLSAEPTPRLGKGNVLFSTEDAVKIYDYFVKKMHADLAVLGLSDWKRGEPVAPGAEGDVLSVEMVPELPNSSMNYPVDQEGNEIRPRWLIRDGIAQDFCGSRQFSQYLGLEESSLVTNCRVSGGTLTREEIPECLEVVEFSDFHVDPMSGDIAGEIRLGYLRKGEEVRIVTGGSVSGSMLDAAKTMRFSKETVQYNNREIPRLTLLRGLRIMGV